MNRQQQMDHSSQGQTSGMLEITVAVMELRAERMQVGPSKALNILAKLSNNLYNETNYHMRQ